MRKRFTPLQILRNNKKILSNGKKEKYFILMHKKKKFVTGFILFFITLFIFTNLSVSLAQEVSPSAMSGQGNNKISLDIKGMDILDVLKILSMRSDLNIVAGRNVRGNVTMFLKDVDVWDAFEIILAANDLAYEKRGNIINVMSQRDYELLYGEKYQDRRVVKTIKIKYARVEDISAALSQIKTNIGKVVADEPSKTVVLMDIPYKVTEMEGVINNLDILVITKVYEFKYAKVKDLKDRITEMLTKNIGSMRIDERTNKIAITDTERKIAEFDKIIEAFDEKHKEVEIEAMILELTLNDEYVSGINWDMAFQQLSKTLSRTFGDQNISVNLPNGFGPIMPTTTSTSTENGGAYQIGNLEAKGFQAVIKFLQTYGKTNILSNPRITVLNNEEAKILVGKNQPYATTTASQGQTTTQTAANITYLDLGVKLTVTPTINKDGFVTMKVKPEVSSSSSNLTYNLSGGTNTDKISNTVPIVETSSTETTVMIKDRNTIMLSGLIQKRDEENVKKIPGLGDIPFFGGLFRSTTKGSISQTGNTTGSGEPERKEIIIFLTPKIVYGEGENIFKENKEKYEKQQQEKETLQESIKDKNINEMLSASEQKLSIEKLEKSSEPIIWNEHMDPGDYYKLVWQKAHERVIANKPNRTIPGEVTVSFMLSADGKLIEEPVVYTLPDTDPELVQIALNSIEEAVPFPSFPSTIKKEQETFKIDISYE